MSERFSISRPGTNLVGERWAGRGPTVVLLHAGVADRRSWATVADELVVHATVVTYDRRGFGETSLGTESYSHLRDLLGVLDHFQLDQVWLVGSSAGGRVALDAAVSVPERVAGLVLFAPAVSGAPEPDPELLGPELRWFDGEIDKQIEASNLDELNRLETWLWLDGPTSREGRVSGPARELALEMNRVALANDAGETDYESMNAWGHLEDTAAPTTVACGSLDVAFLIERCEVIAQRVPRARYRCLEGMAHLPYLEDPSAVASVILEALQASSRGH